MEDSSSSGEGPRDASDCRSETAGFRLTKEDRIRKSSDYRRIMTYGRRYRTPHFQVRMSAGTQGRTRLGIIAGKRVGNACARNRIKRRLREYFRLNRDTLPCNTDIVFVCLKGAAELNTNQVRSELGAFFEKRFQS